MIRNEDEIISSWKYGSAKNPIVTICVLVFNHEKYLEESIEGILSQKTEYSYNILIHDDASTDKSRLIIKRYAEKYPNLFLCLFEKENQYSKKDGSIGRKMSPFCVGTFLAYCEGDDYWIDEKKLQKQIEFLVNNPLYSAVYCNILPVNEASEYEESLRGMYVHLEEGDYTDEDISHGLLRTQVGTLVCKNFLRVFSEEEIEVYLRCKANGDEKKQVILGKLGKLHYLSDTMVAHRKVYNTGDSWTAKGSSLSRIQKEEAGYFIRIELAKLYEYYYKKKPKMWEDLLYQRCLIRRKYHRLIDDSDKESYDRIMKDHTVCFNVNYISFIRRILKHYFD